MEVSAVGRGVPEGGDVGVSGLDRPSARGPEDRKRLAIATMSPEDLVGTV